MSLPQLASIIFGTRVEEEWVEEEFGSDREDLEKSK
jgi:hypothetical protein